MPYFSKLEGMIGSVEVSRVLDSYFLGLTAQTFFPDFDREAVRPHLSWLAPGHLDPETGRIPLPVQTFLLKTDHHVILIDTCLGNDKKRPGLFEGDHLSTKYLERLTAAGVTPEDVDFVMCSHLHVDHIGWNTRLNDGRWQPTFPNARYIFSEQEFLAAQQEAARPQTMELLRNCFEDSVMPVVEAGQATLVNGVHEMLDGFTLRPAPGHSPGHMRIELRSKGELGVFAGDLLHSPIQIPMWQWSSIACWNQEMAANSRRELLEFCEMHNALMIPAHFEAPHVARIRRKDGQFMPQFGWH